MPKFPKLKINAGSSPVEVVMGCRGKLTAFVPSIKEQGKEKLICMECGKHHNEHFVQRMSCVNIFWHKELNKLVSALMKIADIPNHPDLVPTSELVKWIQERAINAISDIGEENENKLNYQ